MISHAALLLNTQSQQWQAGEALAGQGLLRELRRGEGLIEYMVTLEPYALVRLRAMEDSTCDCGRPHCEHLAAAYLAARQSGALRELEGFREQALSDAFLDAVESILPQAPALTLEPSLFIEGDGVSLGLRVGEGRLYVVRHLPGFLRALSQLERIQIAPGLALTPDFSAFSPQDAAFLHVLTAYMQSLEQAGIQLSTQQARKLRLPGEVALALLEKLEGMRFRLSSQGRTLVQQGIQTTALPAVFYVSGGARGIKIRAEVDTGCKQALPGGRYLMLAGQLVRVQEEDIRLTALLMRHDDRQYTFPRGRLSRVTGELLPTLMRRHAVVIDEALERKMIRLPLKARIYLDKAGDDIAAKVNFVYGDTVIDPFSLEKTEPALLLHDAMGERRVLEAMSDTGFHVRKGYVYVAGEENVYQFLTQGVQALSRQAELFLSADFKRMKPRTPSLRAALSGESGRLELKLYDDDTPMEELAALLHAIRSRKQYFRYKDGSFISLGETEPWQGFAQAALEAAEEDSALRDMKPYRAAYLQALIKSSALPALIDQSAQMMASPPVMPVESPVAGLHPYQQRGFEWLIQLRLLGMGGILADEMGLGKTVQTIAAIRHSVETEQQRIPSIIVMPTSLLYNWQSEFKRFAPQVKAQIVSGSRSKRQLLLEAFTGPDAPDVLLTSYPLIRQDIDLLREIPFRYAVLDEAQFIKNTLSLSARAVKRLQAQTRLALSGTPMENNVAELFSLFDFVLPGYLPKAREFLRRYDGGRSADDLMARIRPFLMRRLKKDVMAQLPPKIESLIPVTMPGEQRKVYNAVLAQKRLRIEGLMAHSQLSFGRAQVLQALMELRQICCHPALVLPHYTGESGKLTLLMDILPEALADGHRVLIFSQFTQMLKILRRSLNQEGIQTLYLDGDTKPEERQALVERFNTGGEPVFLISLKAGGTGLNLTGADTVIHFDPWWNPSSEDQAADRAHRLGQEKPVQVIRLVMQGSVEEQVLQMSRSKRRLFEKLITPGEVMPQKLSQDEILRLFDKQVQEEAEAEREGPEQAESLIGGWRED